MIVILSNYVKTCNYVSRVYMYCVACAMNYAWRSPQSILYIYYIYTHNQIYTYRYDYSNALNQIMVGLFERIRCSTLGQYVEGQFRKKSCDEDESMKL